MTKNNSKAVFNVTSSVNEVVMKTNIDIYNKLNNYKNSDEYIQKISSENKNDVIKSFVDECSRNIFIKFDDGREYNFFESKDIIKTFM